MYKKKSQKISIYPLFSFFKLNLICYIANYKCLLRHFYLTPPLTFHTASKLHKKNVNTILFPRVFPPVHFKNNGKHIKIPFFSLEPFLEEIFKFQSLYKKTKICKRGSVLESVLRYYPQNYRFRPDFKDLPVQFPVLKKSQAESSIVTFQRLRMAKINVIWLLRLSNLPQVPNYGPVG